MHGSDFGKMGGAFVGLVQALPGILLTCGVVAVAFGAAVGGLVVWFILK
jgi:hypothetical protein